MMCYTESEVCNSTSKIPEDLQTTIDVYLIISLLVCIAVTGGIMYARKLVTILELIKISIQVLISLTQTEALRHRIQDMVSFFSLRKDRIHKRKARLEEPQKDLKNFRMNVLPAVTSSTEFGKHPIVEGLLRKKDNSEMPDCISEAKRELVMIRDIEFMQTLQDPKMDMIFLYYVDGFKPSNIIISLIAEGKSPRPHAILMYEQLRLCTLRTYSRNNKPFLTKYPAAGFYYASYGEDGVCYCHGLRRYGWVEADDRMEVHKRINPRCKCIINSSEHNFPAIADGPLRQTVVQLDMIPDCIRAQSPGEDVNNSQGTITEEPRTDLKNFRTNVLPAVTSSTEIGKLPIVETLFGKKDDSEIYDCRCEAKRPMAMKRDIILMQTLPNPQIDRILLYYFDRFKPLILVISQISEVKLPRPQVTMRYDLLPLCTFRTQKRVLSTLRLDTNSFLTKNAAAGFYYASKGEDRVCYCCGLRRYGLVEADDRMVVHKRINPRCKCPEEDINNSQGSRTDDPSNYLYNNHFRKAYQSDCNESIFATREIQHGIDSKEEKNRILRGNGNLNQLKIVNRIKTCKGFSDELRKRTGIDRWRPAQYSEVCYPVNEIITQPIVHQIDMRNELRRLSTFGTYPYNKPSSLRFAAAGFYHTGDGDAVVCFCCGIRRDGWVKRDVPMVVHMNINPGCQFVINNCDFNVPAVVHMQDRKSISRLEAIPFCSQDCGHGDPVHSCGQGVHRSSVYTDLDSEPAQRAVNAGYSAEQVRDIIIYRRSVYGHQIETVEQILETAFAIGLNTPNLPLAAVDHGSDVPASFGETSNEVSSTEETSSNRP